ncbi:hypothetical protein [Polymorphospora sp. NPDC050346]|uniref:hypothetical protein n=1 Tax=Polymorphospora sp. NPDC050346 TaxID=3155780 RepID=UPI0033FC4BAC
MNDNDTRRRPEVAAGMAAARALGVHVGRPRVPVPAGAVRADELRTQGLSYAAIAAILDREQVPTPSGRGRWSKRSVQYVIDRLRGQSPA